MSGVEQVVANDGLLPYLVRSPGSLRSTPRKRGLKQGLMLFLSTFLIVPVIAIITVAIGAPPYMVAIASIVLAIGGLLRMVYALLFETNEPAVFDFEMDPAARELGGNSGAKVHDLPAAGSIPASGYIPPAGNWRTSDLVRPSSVTDSTTKLLEENDQ